MCVLPEVAEQVALELGYGPPRRCRLVVSSFEARPSPRTPRPIGTGPGGAPHLPEEELLQLRPALRLVEAHQRSTTACGAILRITRSEAMFAAL